MFINQIPMNHPQDSVAPAGLINSIPGSQFNESNYNNQSSLGRNILFKPIEFVSNHRRSASLSGLVKRSSIRKKKSKLPTATTLNTHEDYLTNTTNPNHPGSQPEAISNPGVNPPQPTLNSDFISAQTSLNSYQSSHQATAHLNTLPIIQPRSSWSPSYEVDRRCFRINLNHPRQQVTSLLALSSIPRPITPPFDDERENTASAILNATRTAIEEEAIRAAIAASIETENNRMMSHWADHQKFQETDQEFSN